LKTNSRGEREKERGHGVGRRGWGTKSFLFFRKETTTMGQLIILFVGLSFDKLNCGSYCNFKGTSFKLLYIY